MNPVLLKPQSEIGAQVVVQGKVIGNARAREYQALKPKLMRAVLDSYARAEARGRPRARSKARAAQPKSTCARATSPIWASPAPRTARSRSIGDIDRGGIFAQIFGTQGGARARGRRDHRRLHRQQVPRRREPVSRRHAALAAHRLARFRPLPFFADAARLAGGRRVRPRRERARQARGGDHRRADAGAHRQFRRFRSVAAGARRAARLRARRASRCRSPTSSSCPAARRRSPISSSFVGKAGISTSSRMRGAAGGCWAFAAAIRCSANRVRPARHGGAAGRRRGPRACSTSPPADGREALEPSRRRVPHEWRAIPGLRDACRRDGRARLRPAAPALRRRAPSMARSRRTAASRALMCMGCSPTTDSARRGSRSLERRPRSATRRRSSARSTRSPIIARRISTVMRCSRPAR